MSMTFSAFPEYKSNQHPHFSITEGVRFKKNKLYSIVRYGMFSQGGNEAHLLSQHIGISIRLECLQL